MNLFTGRSSDAFFGGEVPAAARSLLHRAASSGPADRAALLWTAQTLAPQCLAIYYTLYKHHAGRREFELAERAAWRGLHEAAAAAGIAADWREVEPPLPPEVGQSEAGRFWLFTLKALAFILLRSGRADAARELLRKLDACDPGARIGGEVIATLLDAAAPRPGPAR